MANIAKNRQLCKYPAQNLHKIFLQSKKGDLRKAEISLMLSSERVQTHTYLAFEAVRLFAAAGFTGVRITAAPRHWQE